MKLSGPGPAFNTLQSTARRQNPGFAYTQYSFVQTTSSTANLALTFTTRNDIAGWLLDDVSIRRTVPEVNGKSAAVPLFLMGFLGLFWSDRRRLSALAARL